MVLGRVFGVLEGLAIAALGLGALVAPLLVMGLGPRPAIVATGMLLPALALLFASRVRRVDSGAEVPNELVDLLRVLPLFAPLPPRAIEQLAARLAPIECPAGAEVVRQGEPGERFYVVAAGQLDVTVDGGLVRTLERGESFGEIALLRDVPRTATVTAKTPATLYALERDVFVGAVAGDPASSATADEVIKARLGATRMPTAPL